ncbi:MAG: DUF3060 domain-containing protein [Deltaproteobacteria bacterium]|nr:DUF3060 domain-containing protein [Deltaproteobacteria bacterium]
MKTQTSLALSSAIAFSFWGLAALGQSSATVQGNRIKVSDGVNTVDVDLSQGARVTATDGAGQVDVDDGQGNRVKVKAGATQVDTSAGGVSVKTHSHSHGNARKPEHQRAPARALEPLSISGNDEKHDEDCAGRDVDVSGNDLKVTLRGECGRVEVSGNDNVVDLDVAADIEVVGNANKVTWARGPGTAKPKISKAGSDNEVKQRRR